MKVIKQGKIKEEPGNKIECPNCNSELEYAKHDVVVGRSLDLKNLGTQYNFIVCAVCSSVTKVE